MKVFDSGVVSSFDMSDLEFILMEKPYMCVILHIEGDTKEDEALIETQVTENEKLKVSVKNPHVNLNFGPGEPIRIGHIEGKPLYFTFRVDVFGDYTSYQTSYTFFVEV
jgi:hypothetical protein